MLPGMFARSRRYRHDRGGALARGRAHAIHRGVAAADDDHALARGVQGAVVEQRHRIAQSLAVAYGQIIECRYDAAEARAGAADVARLVDAGRHQHRVMPGTQL